MASVWAVPLWQSCHVNVTFHMAFLGVCERVNIRPITLKRRMTFLKGISILFFLVTSAVFP
jgi:hypothetical protein